MPVMSRLKRGFLLLGVIFLTFPVRSDSVEFLVSCVVSDQFVSSYGRAQYGDTGLCLNCTYRGNHRIGGGFASTSWGEWSATQIYEQTLRDDARAGVCYKGYIEAWGAAGFYGQKESAQDCAPCVLFVEKYGSGSVSGAPIGKSTYNCGASVTVNATAASGWEFTGWSGDITSQSASLTFTLNASKSLTANFESLCERDCPVPCEGSPPSCPSGGQAGENDGEGTGCTPWYNCSPLVLDLNGDGIHTTSLADPVWFDLTGDGRQEQIAWTDPTTDEAFLWLDVDPNGRVDDGKELFGIGTILASGARARHGFEALAQYDDATNGGNGDGKITTADAVWNRLRLWVDINHDGVCEPTESGPVERYGLTWIDLHYSVNYEPDAQGNIHGLRGTYEARLHGTAGTVTRAIHDVFFQSAN
jgi:hypothetical protein